MLIMDPYQELEDSLIVIKRISIGILITTVFLIITAIYQRNKTPEPEQSYKDLVNEKYYLGR